ncbi:hypothetical protein [Runella sp.]|uniref:hypothetical protein n=1 Tax=Runella sp. TaxID=1960881 RepID=UPI003017A90D
MKKTKYAHDAKTTIYHAMIPSEPETLGNYALEFPQLFIELDELGDDFERWYNEEKHVLLKDFQHEYRENLMSKGNYYAKLIYDEFTTAWVKEQYYKDLIVFFEEDEKKHFELQVNEANSKNYQQARYHLEKRKENNKLILKAKAALYFINQTKAFVKPDFGIPDIIPPVSTSTELIELTKNAKTIQAEKNHFAYTNRYVELRKSVKPNYNRERAIEVVLKEFGISEKTLCRAFDANRETLLKFGHIEKNFNVFRGVKWS